MTTLIKFFVILFLIVGIIGGAAFFAYEMYWKPKMLDIQEEEEIAIQEALPPPPHPSIAALDAARALLDQGSVSEGRAALESLLVQYPDSPKLAEARSLLGSLNVADIFSPAVQEGKTIYTVVSGDALAKIGSKSGVSPELIFRANNLDTINLQIGQILLLPNLDVHVVINRAEKTLTLNNADKFLKSYPLLSASVPGLGKDKVLEAKVSDQFAMQDNKRVAFGSKDFVGAERTILISPGGVILRSQAEGSDSMPSGLVLSPADLSEVSVLVTRGTPVTIE